MVKLKKPKSKSKPKSNRALVFGAPIIQDDESSIPSFVYRAMAFLQQHAREGIFRVPGSQSDMERAKKELNDGDEAIHLYQKQNLHTVASLLKLYFRELPEPLLTFDQYDMFIAADGINEANARLKTIKKLLDYLPPANKKLLHSLCEFLKILLQSQSQTLMTSQNLAVIFAPNLLRSRDDNLSIMISDSPAATGLMKTLIEDFDYLFADFSKQNDTNDHESTKQEDTNNTRAPPPPPKQRSSNRQSTQQQHTKDARPPPPPPKQVSKIPSISKLAPPPPPNRQSPKPSLYIDEGRSSQDSRRSTLEELQKSKKSVPLPPKPSIITSQNRRSPPPLPPSRTTSESQTRRGPPPIPDRSNRSAF